MFSILIKLINIVINFKRGNSYFTTTVNNLLGYSFRVIGVFRVVMY